MDHLQGRASWGLMFLAAVCFISGCSRLGGGGTAAEGSTKPKECVGLPPLPGA
jgi:hypothetical protein